MPEKNMLGKCCLDGVSKEPGSQLQHISPELCKYPYRPVPAEGLAQIFPTCSSFFSKSVCFFRGGVSCKASDEMQKWQIVFFLDFIRQNFTAGSGTRFTLQSYKCNTKVWDRVVF